MQIDKLSADERHALAAELNAKLSEWETESADWEAESKAWQAEAAEHARRFRASELVAHLQKLRGEHLHHEVSGPLQDAIVAAIAALPADPPDPVATRRRQEARALREKITVPLVGAVEDTLLRSFENAIEAADKMQWAADAPMRAAYARIKNS